VEVIEKKVVLNFLSCAALAVLRFGTRVTPATVKRSRA
jgi:hypothetical protein